MYYYLRSRVTGMVKAISKHPSIQQFANKEWKCERSEEWPFADAAEELTPPTPATKKAEPTVRPKFKTSNCAYLMYV